MCVCNVFSMLQRESFSTCYRANLKFHIKYYEQEEGGDKLNQI